jgi:hypothetical protein
MGVVLALSLLAGDGTHLLIWNGVKDGEPSGPFEQSDLAGFGKRAGVRFDPRMPRRIASRDYPGLNPGFTIDVVGGCATKGEAERLVKLLRPLWSGLYVRRTTNMDFAGTCPAVLADERRARAREPIADLPEEGAADPDTLCRAAFGDGCDAPGWLGDAGHVCAAMHGVQKNGDECHAGGAIFLLGRMQDGRAVPLFAHPEVQPDTEREGPAPKRSAKTFSAGPASMWCWTYEQIGWMSQDVGSYTGDAWAEQYEPESGAKAGEYVSSIEWFETTTTTLYCRPRASSVRSWRGAAARSWLVADLKPDFAGCTSWQHVGDMGLRAEYRAADANTLCVESRAGSCGTIDAHAVEAGVWVTPPCARCEAPQAKGR